MQMEDDTMGTKWLAAVALVLLCAAGGVRAGVYNSLESAEQVLSPDFRVYRNTFIKFRGLGNREFPTPMKRRTYLTTDLITENTLTHPLDLNLSAGQYLNASSYLIWVNRSEDAIRLLQPVLHKYRDELVSPDLVASTVGLLAPTSGPTAPLGAAGFYPPRAGKLFLLSANLGTAYQLAGQLENAETYLTKAYNSWPANFADLTEGQRHYLLQFGWSEGQSDFFRKVESYHLRLVKLRLEERVPSQTLDALFVKDGKPVRFVGPSGQYEPGKIAPAEAARLPSNSLEIVQQMLVWLPNDSRLYWLQGELLNARGDYEYAYEIFDDLVFRRNERFPELMSHRRALFACLQEKGKQAKRKGNEPVAKDKRQSPAPGPTSVSSTSDGTAMFNAWPFTVGCGTGAVITLFAVWQVRALRRRKVGAGMK
jgi:tetratricopeptide (TPR) repeat protein